MSAEKKVRVAIVGLGFGAEFIPIYQAHPNAEMAAVCRRNKTELDACGDKYKIAKRYERYEDLLKDPDIDAVHINSPIPDHAAADDRRPEGREARRLHRADGDDEGRDQGDRRTPA